MGKYDDANAKKFAKQITPIIQGAQVRTAALTDSYLATVESAVLGRTVRPLGVRPAVVAYTALRGTAPGDSYLRPFQTVWWRLSAGEPVLSAITSGKSRLMAMALTDIQLAKTHTVRHVLSRKSNVTGYRRVLESGEPCDLCSVATSQRYKTDELMPLHPGCDCSVEPIYGDSEPLGIGNDPIDTDTQVVVQEHGELGPVLAVKGQSFTGPDDID